MAKTAKKLTQKDQEDFLIRRYLYNLPLEDLVDMASSRQDLVEDIEDSFEDADVDAEVAEERASILADAKLWQRRIDMIEVDKSIHKTILGGE